MNILINYQMLKSKKSFYKFITNSLVVNKELAK